MFHISESRSDIQQNRGAYSTHTHPSNPSAAKFALPGDAHMRTDAQIKFLYYPLMPSYVCKLTNISDAAFVVKYLACFEYFFPVHQDMTGTDLSSQLVRGSCPPLFQVNPPSTFSKIPPLLRFPLFQKSKMSPRSIRKTKVLNESCNQFVQKFYLQSILILEEYLLKR